MLSIKNSLFSIIFIMLILFITGCQKQENYEKGNEYLRNKLFAEALSEYQKVEASDKNFRLAQSKINYTQGLLAFKDNLFQVAETHLQKVEKDDEYYHDSQLMLEQINESKLAEVKKDTVIVKHEVTSESSSSGSKTGEKEKVPPTDAEINKKYVSLAENLVNKFESLYQSARTAEVSRKRDYTGDMSKVLSQFESLSYNPSVKDGAVLDLKQKVISWMSKRITFINRLVSDNTISETSSSRSLKEEGDKMYYGVTQQLKKVK